MNKNIRTRGKAQETCDKAEEEAPERGTYPCGQGAAAHEAQADERASALTARSDGVHRATHSLVPTHATGGRGRSREEGSGRKKQARTEKLTGNAKERASIGEARPRARRHGK